MKRYIRLVAVLAVCVLTLAGCSTEIVPKFEESDVICVGKDGVITSYLISDFDKEYYVMSELMSMAVEDAASYNAEHQEGELIPLVVESVQMNGDKVIVQHKYSRPQDYSGYNGCKFFYGTVEDAIAAGYDLSALLTGVKDKEPLSQEELMEKADKTYVLISDAKAVVYCERKITHVGDGVAYLEDGSVDISTVDGTAVILMK